MGRFPVRPSARGWVFLAGGLVLTVVSLAVGQTDLAWVGLLLVLVPVLGMALVGLTRLRMSCHRHIEPARCALGSHLEVTTTLDRDGGLPVGILRFEETVPRALGERPRFAIHTLSGSWHRRVGYRLEGRARGHFTVGPLRVRACDPFGTAVADHAFTSSNHVMVTPRIHPLTTVGAAAGVGRSGESTPHRVGMQGQDDVLIREYRQGDDLRRVHWRSTARKGDLMVRREEQAWDPSLALLLDSRASRHAGQGAEGSFEWAVSATASIADHMISNGYRVAVCDAEGVLVEPTSAPVTTARETSIVALTDASLSGADDLATGIAACRSARSGQTVVAVLGRLTLADASALDGLRAGRPVGMAVVLDPDTFTARRFRGTVEEADEHLAAIDALQTHGWRTVVVTAGMSMPEVWAALGRQEVTL